MKPHRSVAGFLAVLVLPLLHGCEGEKEPDVVQREGEPDFVKQFDQGRMNAAIAEARSTLDTFVGALKAKKPGTDTFAIKKGFTYGSDGVEYMWLTDIRTEGGGFVGKVNNAPVNPVKVKLGDTVQVSRDEIVDWMFMADGKLQGGCTIVALSYGSEQQAQHEMEMGIDWSKYEFLKKEK